MIPVTGTATIKAEKTNVQTSGIILDKKMLDPSTQSRTFATLKGIIMFVKTIKYVVLTKESKHCVQSSRYTA